MFSITDDTVFENYPKMSHFLNGWLTWIFGTLIPPKCSENWGSNFENSFEIFSNETVLSYFQTLRMTSVFKKVADHSLNDTTYFISFEFWIMTSISGRLEWIEKRLFHLRQKNTTAIVTQYCTFHSVWKMGNFQTLCTICMTTFLAKL